MSLSPCPTLYCLPHNRESKSTVEVLGQGIATLFGKPVDQENGGLVSQRTTTPKLEQAFAFILKGERVWMVLASFLGPFVFAALLMGQVMMFIQTVNKYYFLFCTVEVFASILTKPEIYVK